MEMTKEEPEIWKRLNECEAVKKVFGCEWLYGDKYLDDGEIQTIDNESLRCCLSPPKAGGNIWIPPLYDPIRPERSLWGMSAGIREEWSVMQAGIFIASERPDLFLAEMIIEQEGE